MNTRESDVRGMVLVVCLLVGVGFAARGEGGDPFKDLLALGKQRLAPVGSTQQMVPETRPGANAGKHIVQGRKVLKDIGNLERAGHAHAGTPMGRKC